MKSGCESDGQMDEWAERRMDAAFVEKLALTACIFDRMDSKREQARYTYWHARYTFGWRFVACLVEVPWKVNLHAAWQLPTPGQWRGGAIVCSWGLLQWRNRRVQSEVHPAGVSRLPGVLQQASSFESRASASRLCGAAPAPTQLDIESASTNTNTNTM